ncbi:hypothetical protein L6R49_10555 [Myxococcota bacterium]|nr:hypothetical protein [Myxococcota bacterium]
MEKVAVITWNLRAGPPTDPALVENDAEADEEAPPQTTTPGADAGRVERCVVWLTQHLQSLGIERAVAVFQEVPESFAALLAGATEEAWSVVGAAQRHVAIATLGPLTATNVEALSSSAMDRALRVDVDGLLASRVRIVGLHWLDRWSTQPGSPRDKMAGVFCWNVRNQWDYPEAPHFIVLGDFNESPYDSMLVSLHGLWAIRDRADLRRTHPIDKRPPLYNPMWSFLPERREPPHGPHGTYHWYKNSVSGVRWWHIDQILLSPSAVDQLERVDILIELNGQRIVNKRGKPDVRLTSDHLPVIAILGA